MADDLGRMSKFLETSGRNNRLMFEHNKLKPNQQWKLYKH